MNEVMAERQGESSKDCCTLATRIALSALKRMYSSTEVTCTSVLGLYIMWRVPLRTRVQNCTLVGSSAAENREETMREQVDI
jgi:hypothetical protein